MQFTALPQGVSMHKYVLLTFVKLLLMNVSALFIPLVVYIINFHSQLIYFLFICFST